MEAGQIPSFLFLLTDRTTHRQELRHVLCGVGKLSEIDEITVQRLVVAHTFVCFSHALVFLNRLN